MFSVITVFSHTLPAQRCKSTCCQRFLSTDFLLWLRETPKKPFLWIVSTSGGFLTDCANNRNHSWLGYRPSGVFKMPRATQWSYLAKPAGRYCMSHMEIAKMGNKAAGAEVTSFPCRGGMSIRLWSKAPLPRKCPLPIEYHQPMAVHQMGFQYILPISFLLLWLVPEITTFWKKTVSKERNLWRPDFAQQKWYSGDANVVIW